MKYSTYKKLKKIDSCLSNIFEWIGIIFIFLSMLFPNIVRSIISFLSLGQ